MTGGRHPLRVAVEARDPDAIRRSFAPDARFFSPFSAEPFRGREQAAAALAAFGTTLEGLEYTEEFGEGSRRAIGFRAWLGDRELVGVDVLIDAEDGSGIEEFHLFFRPLPGLEELREAVRPKFAAAGVSFAD